MPIDHIVDKKTGIMHVRRWGEITTQDEENALIKRRQDPLVVPGISVLVDCREVDPPDTTEVTNHIAARVSAIAEELHCGPVAIVVSSDTEYGMARMFVALTELKHSNKAIFRCYDEALDWLYSQSDCLYKSVNELQLKDNNELHEFQTLPTD